jgi:hypothetical protein
MNILTLRPAELTYSVSTSSKGLYGTLAELAAGHLINNRLASGSMDGYRYEVVLSADRKRFEVFGVPERYGVTGKRSFFYSSEDPRLRAGDRNGARATGSDPPIN